jgi:limonene-1,2-epoxide hydrolase
MDAAVETVESFFQALMDKDYQKAYTFISDDDKGQP